MKEWLAIVLLLLGLTGTAPAMGSLPSSVVAGCIMNAPVPCMLAFANQATALWARPSEIVAALMVRRPEAAAQRRDPYGIAVGPDGNIWFAERSYRAVGRISIQGAIHEFPLPAPSRDVAEGPDGNIWIGLRDAIGWITPRGVVKLFPLEMDHGPYALRAGRDGAIWYTAILVHRIGRITMAGKVSETDVKGAGSYPRAITSGPDGAIWFTQSKEIGRLTMDGKLVLYALPASSDTGLGICAGPDGNLWISVVNHIYGDWIGRMTPAGKVTKFAFQDDPTPMGITAGPDGSLWFTENSKSRIGKISVTGQLIEYKLPHDGSYPADIVTGPDGNLWFTEEGRDTIGRITPEGKITEFPIPGGIGEES